MLGDLDKRAFNAIHRLVKSNARQVTKNQTWLSLVLEYGLGEIRGNTIHFTQSDLQTWRKLVSANTGLDPIKPIPSGDRTQIAQFSKNEKWADQRPSEHRVFVTALNTPITLSGETMAVVPEVEYKVDYRRIQIQDYDKVLVIENEEAYIYIHRFKLPFDDRCLVLYRGHDVSARAAIDFLTSLGQTVPVYYFCDPDPAGIAIVVDAPNASHIVIPDLSKLDSNMSLSDRFEKQNLSRPRDRYNLVSYSQDFISFVDMVFSNRLALTQEYLCTSECPLLSIRLR